MTVSVNIAQTDRRRGSEHLFLEGLSDLDPKRLRQGGTAEIGESLDVFEKCQDWGPSGWAPGCRSTIVATGRKQSRLGLCGGFGAA